MPEDAPDPLKPAPAPIPAPKPAPAPSGTSDRQLWLKEIITALLGLGAFSFFICFAFMFTGLTLPASGGGDEIALVRESYQAHAENVRKVVDLLFAITSAFIGYYAGRVPAERAANASQKLADAKTGEADTANAAKTKAQERESQAKDLLGRALPTLRAPAPPPDAASRPVAGDAGLAAEIDAFLKRA